MQRLIALRVRDEKRVGNWSGTGAGKTLSAVLASRVIGAQMTLVCCPNSVVGGINEKGWKSEIEKIYPDSLVCTKTFHPNWADAAGDETGLGAAISNNRPRYLVLNYEAFQQEDSDLGIRSPLLQPPAIPRQHIKAGLTFCRFCYCLPVSLVPVPVPPVVG